MSVLVCNSKKWFSALDQILMGGGNASPAYDKARELQSYAYSVRWTKPVPDSTSTLAKAMDADIQTAASIVSTLGSATVSTAAIGSSFADMEALCSSIVANDTAWASASTRPPVTAQLAAAESKCGFFNPLVCVEDVGGALLKWAAIGAVLYFGGKWVLKRTGASTKLAAATRRLKAA